MLPAESATSAMLRAAEPSPGVRKGGVSSWTDLAKQLASSPALKKKGVQ